MTNRLYAGACLAGCDHRDWSCDNTYTHDSRKMLVINDEDNLRRLFKHKLNDAYLLELYYTINS